MALANQPTILPGDVVYAAPISNVNAAKYTVISASGTKVLCYDSTGATVTLTTSSIRRIYRNGVLVWQG